MKNAVISCLCIFILMTACSNDDPESSQSKMEYGLLQKYEFDFRSTKPKGIEIITIDQYRLISVLSSQNHRIWILANPKSGPFYKQCPKGFYKLSEADFKDIVEKARPTQTVMDCLSSHVDVASPGEVNANGGSP